MQASSVKTIDRGVAERHWRWVQRGRVGSGRLVADGLDARGCRLDGEKLNAARLSRIDLSAADLSYTVLDEAEISDCALTQAQLSSAGLVGAAVERCVFRSVQAHLLDAGRSRMSDCDFRAADLERTSWRDAAVTRCDFARARLGHARFDRARFEDCDFRDADLTGAVADGTVFRNCRFEGTRAIPYAAIAVEFHPTRDARYPLEAHVGDALWRIRVNEFPEEPTPYSMLVGDQAVADLMEWPSAWTRPDSAPVSGERSETPHDPHEAAQLRIGSAHDELTRGIPPSKRVE